MDNEHRHPQGLQKIQELKAKINKDHEKKGG